MSADYEQTRLAFSAAKTQYQNELGSLATQLNEVKSHLAETRVQAREDMDTLKRAHKQQMQEFAQKHAKARMEMSDKHELELKNMGTQDQTALLIQQTEAEHNTQCQEHKKQLSQHEDTIDLLKNEQRDLEENHEKDKAELLAPLNEMQTAHSKNSESTRQEHEQAIEQLRQDMNSDFEKQYTDQQQAYEEGVARLSDTLKEQKEADLKRLSDEYEAKIAEFTTTMESSIDFIEKQKTETTKWQKQYSELLAELEKSKSSTKKLQKTCSELEANIKKQQHDRDKEIEDLVAGKKQISDNYDERIKKATGVLKAKLLKEKEESLKVLRIQTESVMSLTNELSSSKETIRSLRNEVERYKMEVEGHKTLLKNTPRKEIDLTSEVNAPSLSGAEITKAVLQHKLKEASDNAMFCVVNATGTLPTSTVLDSLTYQYGDRYSCSRLPSKTQRERIRVLLESFS